MCIEFRSFITEATHPDAEAACAEVKELHKFCYETHPNLNVAKSTLGTTAGVGLFAKDFIPDEQIICYFWGHLVLATHASILDPRNEALHSGLRKNVIQFPDSPYNPIVYPMASTTQDGDDVDDTRLHLYLVASNCCYGSFANTAGQDECNARIIDKIPPGWPSRDGYKNLDHFKNIISSPIQCLQATQPINPGDEIFAYYDLPLHVPRITRSKLKQHEGLGSDYDSNVSEDTNSIDSNASENGPPK